MDKPLFPLHRLGLALALTLGLASCSQLDLARIYFANHGTEARLDSPLPLRLPFREHKGWIVVQASVNGSPPLDFVVDTGASMLTLLTSPKTDALKLDMSGLRKIAGEGVATVTAAVQPGLDIDFGPLALLDQTVLAIPLDSVMCDKAIEPPPFSGVIGHELFSRYVVEVDHARGELVLHDPETYDYRGDGRVVPAEISGRQPFVQARVQGPDGAPYDARLHVDSGAGIDLSLFPQTSDAIAVPPGGTETTACFVGGLARYRSGTSVQVVLADGPAVETPASYSIGDEVIDTGQNGRIGARFLSRYDVVYDYSRGRIILEPRGVAPAAAP
ncbi:aspartyl protease family protein [Arenimonas sp.]|uniref:aspartyl protease family protein n=1 Tax=Arenimonas sp. TaxID=1872635 RepID=UPI0035B2547A